ncbi:MAG TPA: ABC transporter permease [Chromatiaceae bacterium]|jgi:putative ABC transport system permease protein|nr:MAG: peptide ABC transporter permease [Thiohalocapsa sp. PB-PSB1]QQO53258.1 MAG: ABC transporter permease [Thiohalocapsa sp. PB-PSB1]HBG93927.1 ABC transporter permease [Chromatiaceae bacterium]HCS91478.1 ABC transporter permease [Chromatiaceae bacterium]
MAIVALAWKSLSNRRFTALLTVMSIALSVTLLVGVERLRTEARASFANTLSGTDLIVGARSGPVQLLLYALFRIGDATNNISWQSYQEIAAHPKVAWSVPISLGDSHRGFRVLGTTPGYFEHYRFGGNRELNIVKGHLFQDLYDAVLGAEVADKLGYKLGDSIIVAHGAGEVSFAKHDDKPFRVVGILARTGTPVDQTLHVSLPAIEAIHIDWQSGAPMPGRSISADRARAMDLTPKAITAALIGLKSKVATFQVQRFINDYPREPLLAILPGVALGQLWNLIGIAENALLIVSAFVVVIGLFGMLTALLTSLNERRREMAILRSVGARPGHVFTLIMGEAGFLTLLGVLSGLALLYVLLIAGQPMIADRFGIFIAISGPTAYEWILLGAVVVAGFLVGSIPGYRAYRLSLADGLSVRI